MCTTGIELSAHKIWQWVVSKWGSVMPRPQYGAATQELRDNDMVAWYHVPVSTERTIMLGDRFIPCCEAVMLLFDANEFKLLQEFVMSWQSPDLPQGNLEATLVAGKKRLIPIVSRHDGAANAYITDRYLLEKKADRITDIGPGEYLFVISIKSGAKTWYSPHYYKLFVPAAGKSNGHFNISIAGDTAAIKTVNWDSQRGAR
ncbi:hypothetical protein [Methyloceanibacter sp.]|uniref:hypothetical protein n=1 Tax=Methyloceanibacter sp. TaxID=1965321 RepID=UPI003D6D6B4C